MKRYILFFLVLIPLAGCSIITPVKRTFPDVPPALKERCEALRLISGDNVTITDMLKTVISNYTLYHECSTKVEGWNEWYEEQKKIFNSVK